MSSPKRALLSPELPAALAIALVCAAPVAAQASAEEGPTVRGELGLALDGWMQRMEAFGVHGALLVEVKGEIVLAKGYGIADHATGRPITRATSFHLGSLGKQFTAACILRLEEMGKLSVTDPISAHLDRVPEDKAGITIEQLLTHTSGLPYMPGDGSPLDLPLLFEPGERWAYSNPGYSVLAMIVERVAGGPFDQVVGDLLFEPAGMARTTFVGAREWPTKDVARSYQDDLDLGPVSEDEPDPRFIGAGDVASCLDDLLAWEHALDAGTVLKAETVQRMLAEHARNPGSTIGYGYGWMTATTERNTQLRFHQGNFGGFNCEYRRYIDEGVTIIFLSNHYLAGRSMRNAVMNPVSRIVQGERDEVPDPPHPKPFEAEKPTEPISFELASGARIEARADDAGVWLRGLGQEAVTRISGMDDAFRTLADEANATSIRVLLAAARGERAPFMERVSRSVIAGDLWQGMEKLLAERTAELGDVEDAASLGTTISGANGAGSTIVRMTFERGEVLVQIAWGSDGGIYQVTPVEDVPASRFLSCEEGLVAFDVFSGRSSAIELTPRGEGWSLKIGGEVHDSD